MLKDALGRFFSFPTMLLTALFVSPFFASLDVQQGGPVIRDPDIWWHLRNAETLLQTHHFIHQDAYSFTTLGQPWIDPEWLAELPYLLGFRLLGERGLFLVMLTAFELIIAGVLLLCYHRSGDVKAAFLAAWAAVLFAVINLGPRTILFGWICFIAMLLLLEEFRRGRDRLWLLVPLFCLWINLHGSWVIGFVFFLLFIVSGWAEGAWGSIEAVRWTPPEQRKLLRVAIGSIAALFVNPYGWRLIAYPFDLQFSQKLNVASIDEWQSVDFQSFYGNLFFVVVAGMMVFNLARRRAWPLHELLFALLACYAGLYHKRFLFLTGIVLCPLLAVELAGVVFMPYDPKRNKPLLSAAIMAGYLLFAIDHVPTSAVLRQAEAQYFPVGALPALESSCAGQRVFNRFEWGGYLIWNARATPVFFDSRTDIFEYHGVLADGLNTLNMNDSLGILDRYRIGCVLLDPGEELVYQLRRTPGWRVGYEDRTAVLLRAPE
ncbi:MAG: hypothetical protein ABR991_12620 [Terracidiphilus sp.]|jgi:hypothetical protein